MCGSMGGNDSCFDGPWSPALHIAALTKGKGGVLVPDHQPILLGRLVKQGCAKRECGFAETRARQLHQVTIMRNDANGIRPEDVASTGATALDLRFFQCTKDCRELR